MVEFVSVEWVRSHACMQEGSYLRVVVDALHLKPLICLVDTTCCSVVDDVMRLKNSGTFDKVAAGSSEPGGGEVHQDITNWDIRKRYLLPRITIKQHHHEAEGKHKTAARALLMAVHTMGWSFSESLYLGILIRNKRVLICYKSKAVVVLKVARCHDWRNDSLHHEYKRSKHHFRLLWYCIFLLAYLRKRINLARTLCHSVWWCLTGFFDLSLLGPNY